MATFSWYSERQLHKRLGIPANALTKPLIDEMLDIRKAGKSLARAYEDGAASTLAEAGPGEFARRWSARSIIGHARMSGRQAAYKDLGISLAAVGPENCARLGIKEPIHSDSLFAIAAFGGLVPNIGRMAGLDGASGISVERLFAATPVYRATFTGREHLPAVYFKEASVEAEALASRLLANAGIAMPKIQNVSFRHPRGEMMVYGILEDIASESSEGLASSVRAFARNPELSGMVMENLDGFAFRLGYAFETFRSMGIQDMHSRNLFILGNNGSAGIGVIDSGIVACYAPPEKYMSAYAGVLHTIIDSIDFALKYGDVVRSEPGRLRELLGKADASMEAGRKEAVWERISGPFIAGAECAAEYLAGGKTKAYVKRQLRMHDGRPVGRPRDSRSLKSSWGHHAPVTVMNGSNQRIMSSGPYSGMFMLDWRAAWKSGFLDQLKTSAAEFWGATTRIWKNRMPGWVNGMRVATIAY
ncbi:hypothetical protein L0Y65_05195 [Candidatus Micrarchaeota archaeon]|nr:hypothetical protein [Candidatus Micrarchaeota archaeon]